MLIAINLKNVFFVISLEYFNLKNGLITEVVVNILGMMLNFIEMIIELDGGSKMEYSHLHTHSDEPMADCHVIDYVSGNHFSNSVQLIRTCDNSRLFFSSLSVHSFEVSQSLLEMETTTGSHSNNNCENPLPAVQEFCFGKGIIKHWLFCARNSMHCG